MAKIHYSQCRMTGTGGFFHTAWIPSTFAKVGRNIEIKQPDDSWRPWKVAEVFGTKDAETVERRGHDSTRGFGSVVK